MNELKYEAKQKIIVVLGSLTGQKGWIIQRCEDSSGFDYLVGFPDTRATIRTELMTQDYLMSLDELQTLRTENERLKARVAELEKVIIESRRKIKVAYGVLPYLNQPLREDQRSSLIGQLSDLLDSVESDGYSMQSVIVEATK